MAGTIQKRIKFSKGQIVPELVERTDLDAYDSSAQKMHNVVSTIYGGVRSRRGSKFIDYITTIDEVEPTSVTSDVFSATTHFTDLTKVEASEIGNNKLIAKLDYGTTSQGTQNIEIKDIRLIPISKEYTVGSTDTFNINEGVYKVAIIGASGGGNGHGETSGTNSVYAAAGAAGGSFYGTIKVTEAGLCSVVSGASVSGYNTGGNSSITFPNGYEIIAGGGGGSVSIGNSDGPYAGYYVAGTGGSVSYSPAYDPTLHNETIVAGNGANGQIYWIRGSGVVTVGPCYTAAYSYLDVLNGSFEQRSQSTTNTTFYWEGQPGYVYLHEEDATATVGVYGSDNDTDYVLLKQTQISSVNDDILVNSEHIYRYIKIVIEDEEINYDGLEFKYIRNAKTLYDINNVKLKSFIYNNENKYLLVIEDKKIQIFENDNLVNIIDATGLLKEYLKDLKMATKDDTIIFTHQDMPPKILKHLSDGSWVWGDVQLENIPTTLFGTETRTSKSVQITPSSSEGAVKISASSSVFDSSYVGQYIEGNGGRVKITEFISGTVVNGYTIIPFYTTDSISSWYFVSGYKPVWGYEDPSDTTSTNHGYPRTCLFAQQRLWFGGSKEKPSTVWASRLGDYFNFNNAANYDNDAIDVDLLTNDPIVNMSYNRGVHIFTAGQEISSPEGTYTPDKISFTVNTQNGSLASVEPVSLNGIICFIEKNGKSLLSYVYDDNQAAYISDNLSMLSNLINKPVSMSAEINSSKDKGDFIYIVLDDGSMICCCVSLGQKVISLSKYETSGTIAGVCCLGEDTYLAVIRNGGMCVEKITEDPVDCAKQVYADSIYVSGLVQYNNKEVYIYSDKKNYGKHKVIDNSVTLTENPNEICNVGFAFDYEIESNPIAINHKTTSIKKRITTAEIVCKDTPQLEFCGQKKTGKDNYKFFSCTKYDDDVRFRISGEFYKMQILSVQLNIDYGD